jgi:hypothetical protein
MHYSNNIILHAITFNIKQTMVNKTLPLISDAFSYYTERNMCNICKKKLCDKKKKKKKKKKNGKFVDMFLIHDNRN